MIKTNEDDIYRVVNQLNHYLLSTQNVTQSKVNESNQNIMENYLCM